jgi:hypothetical protein
MTQPIHIINKDKANKQATYKKQSTKLYFEKLVKEYEDILSKLFLHEYTRISVEEHQ